ncbi:hypothetical protein [Paenibacillus glycanilyticus]|uniref:Uncharacterized protein n=1 Tax=Paenibacillus glycanilyticus TaxID=126569 RepID=A0ABQ6GBE2_9BACL|nr:hypothetical protein [Paenibacillus glycanilyticus]GLX68203.1 hypothetical protein MU1_25480 [Paenibacillus glycanilyticus]
MRVVLLVKDPKAGLRQIDDREWDSAMIASLEHVNYLTIHGEEYQTLEGKLNLDAGQLELLLVRMNNKTI